MTWPSDLAKLTFDRRSEVAAPHRRRFAHGPGGPNSNDGRAPWMRSILHPRLVTLRKFSSYHALHACYHQGLCVQKNLCYGIHLPHRDSCCSLLILAVDAHNIFIHNSEQVLVWLSLAKKSCEIVWVLGPMKTDPRSGQVVGAQKLASPLVQQMLHATLLVLALPVGIMSQASNQFVGEKKVRALEPLNLRPLAYQCSMVLDVTWDVGLRCQGSKA